ncbi:uncharacterized protein LOC133307452 [Gastrolobium bilobum]|uniref:uncharacterized protein LOC133307452 n=1 Tax=Gastrolobium bilobum TaxID=150636 RepID=UPI002AAF5334|nr:uncharacterized protein LOC133307452 [Gastrolobium bilobum]
MEVKTPAMKRHFDITMSRRTRKQSIPMQANEKPISVCDTTKNVSQETNLPEMKEDGNDHKSLKQLIIGDENDAMKCSDEGSKGRKELGEHFTEEEKHLQLVRMQQKENLQGLKFKKLVRRYAKVLGHLMKAKRDPHLGEAGKKPVLKLST